MDGTTETPGDKITPLQNGGNISGLPDNTGQSDINSSEAAALDDQIVLKWGFHVDELYRMALTFFKEKDGSKALHTTYKEKLRLVVLTKQVSFGKYRSEMMPDIGFLDVVGNDRKLAWQNLGDMSKETAMAEFVNSLNTLTPLFAPYVAAHRAEKQEQERRKKEESDQRQREEIERLHIQDVAQQQEQDKHRQMSQEMLIRNALNQQTLVQFRQYAEQQCPGNPVQQETLIGQLQEQHFVQYMQQVYQQQQIQQQQYLKQQQQQPLQQQQQHIQQNASNSSQTSPDSTPQKQQQNSAIPAATSTSVLHQTSRLHPTSETLQGAVGSLGPNGPWGSGQGHSANRMNGTGEDVEDQRTSGDGQRDHDDEDIDPNDLPPVAAASMWTRKDLKEFKQSLHNDAESVIKVGSGELVTVRVPTHDDGSCLFWEFATDGYDIGFGVYFEWTVPSANEMSVHASESSDDEELDEDGVRHRTDLPGETKKPSENDPPTDEIIPVYRRDCQEEVYCGSHVYPGRGVYLLKFDNSYSLWRGKTVYYRVYYTR